MDNGFLELSFTGPSERIMDALSMMASLGFHPLEDRIVNHTVAMPRDNFTKGLTLRGIRGDRGLTQSQLSRRSGIAQRHISEMETGKRPIGKDTAQRLARSLQVDYRVLL